MKVRRSLYYISDDKDSKAQKWIFDVLNQTGVTQMELAEKLHTTRQSINKLIKGHTKLTFTTMVAICFVCGIHDDPEEIWTEINKEDK